jgi:RNA polymerase sigma factor (sigma-70 family)
MDEANTTTVVRRYLLELARGDGPSEPIVRSLLGRAVCRLHQLCDSLLRRQYPRLTRPPLNLYADELLGAVVERLIKALREARPENVRQFFALAGLHIRWELNDLARQLDSRPATVEMREALALDPTEGDSGPTPDGRRIFAAIEGLHEDQREAFDLVRVQGMSLAEAGQILGVSAMTVKRRVDRGLSRLVDELADLRPGAESPSS